MNTTHILDLFLDNQDEAFSEAVRAYENKDFSRAHAAFATLAKENDPQAQINLAMMLRDGQGAERDLVAAHMWLELAAHSGDEIAAMELKKLQKQMTPTQLDQAARRAWEWRVAA
ncbi:MAG: SEL1-like repeat protein [Magnetococcales bacterium]|nr:SEL1-like repeat protein [Magnetococcales bacterium]